MIVEIVGRAEIAQQDLRRATIDPSLPREDYAVLEAGSDRLEHLSAADDLSGLGIVARRCRARYVTGDELQPPDREVLRWAQKAVDTVLDSGVYADGLLDQATVKAILAENEWAIATGLRELSALRASREEAVPGRPLSDAAKDRLRARVRAEVAAEGPIDALVAALKSCAAHVEYADAVYDDLQERDSIGELGNQLRDLIVSFSAQRERAEGIPGLKRQACALFDALSELDEQAGWPSLAEQLRITWRMSRQRGSGGSG